MKGVKVVIILISVLTLKTLVNGGGQKTLRYMSPMEYRRSLGLAA